jgi:hypothetical protein
MISSSFQSGSVRLGFQKDALQSRREAAQAAGVIELSKGLNARKSRPPFASPLGKTRSGNSSQICEGGLEIGSAAILGPLGVGVRKSCRRCRSRTYAAARWIRRRARPEFDSPASTCFPVIATAL